MTHCFLVLALLLFVSDSHAQFSEARKTFPEVSTRSEGAQLKTVMMRDLKQYFKTKYPNVSVVNFRLIREVGATSRDVETNFYAWVEVREGRKTVDTGAVSTIVLDGGKIEVKHFVSKQKIESDPSILDTVFPVALRELIRQEAAKSTRRQ